MTDLNTTPIPAPVVTEVSTQKRVLSLDVGSRSMGFAIVDSGEHVLDVGIIDLGVNVQVKACGRVAPVFLKLVEERWSQYLPFLVVIESQPKRGICMPLSHAIQAFFETFFIIAEQKPQCFVAFVSPQSKLLYTAPETHADTNTNSNALALLSSKNLGASSRKRKLEVSERTRKKRFSLDHAEKILSSPHNRESLAKFTQKQHKYKQRTDMADAIVQGLSYLQQHSEN